MSFLALESDGAADDKQWLTYWVCFGAFNIVDQFAGIILQFIPFYYFLKLGFLVFLMHPATMGATTVYENVLKQYVEMYDSQIKEGIQKAQKVVSEQIDNGRMQFTGDSKKEN